MGNLISSHASAVNPFSGAGTIIGFISFGFTLGTFVRVFWEELTTAFKASGEVHDLLGNLKQALYEEQAHLRVIRRRARAEYESAAFQLLADSVRHLIREFKEIEEPFLLEDAGGFSSAAASQGVQYYTQNPPGYYDSQRQHQRGAGSRNRRRMSSTDKEHDYDAFSDYLAAGACYKKMTFRLRLKWLTRRSKAIELSERLATLQTRRIARQVTDLTLCMRFVQNALGGPGILGLRNAKKDIAAAVSYQDQHANEEDRLEGRYMSGNGASGGDLGRRGRRAGRSRDRRDWDTRD